MFNSRLINSIILGGVLISGVTFGSWKQSEQNGSTYQEQSDEIAHESFWTCTSLDSEGNLFSGWAMTVQEAQDQALANCDSYSEVGGDCQLSVESACELIE